MKKQKERIGCNYVSGVKTNEIELTQLKLIRHHQKKKMENKNKKKEGKKEKKIKK